MTKISNDSASADWLKDVARTDAGTPSKSAKERGADVAPLTQGWPTDLSEASSLAAVENLRNEHLLLSIGNGGSFSTDLGKAFGNDSDVGFVFGAGVRASGRGVKKTTMHAGLRFGDRDIDKGEVTFGLRTAEIERSSNDTSPHLPRFEHDLETAYVRWDKVVNDKLAYLVAEAGDGYQNVEGGYGGIAARFFQADDNGQDLQGLGLQGTVALFSRVGLVVDYSRLEREDADPESNTDLTLEYEVARDGQSRATIFVTRSDENPGIGYKIAF